MSEAIASAQSQGGEGVTGEGSDIALAKALQEQEQAWLSLLQGPNPVSIQGDESLSIHETRSSVQTEQHLPDEDWAFALEMQQQEYRQHAMRLAAVQQQEHGNVDVDSMTYESLSMLGDAVGKVKVGLSANCKMQLERCTHSAGCGPSSTGEATCAICQQDYIVEEQICKLPCKHTFHVECIDTWLEDSKCCPVCMCEIKST